MSLKNNLNTIEENIAQALKDAKRTNANIRLVAVSKTVDSDTIREMYSYGQRDFAENRPQMLRDKVKNLSDLQINWHFIGPLQSNKIKYVYPQAYLVHSIDRIELVEEFIKISEKTKHICPILLQVHISGEAAKQGFSCSEILEVIKKYNNNNGLRIRGLMGMAPYDADEITTHNCFKELASLFNKSRSLEGSSYKAEFLSMGMSGDFKIAIAECSNMVRIGSALFKV